MLGREIYSFFWRLLDRPEKDPGTWARNGIAILIHQSSHSIRPATLSTHVIDLMACSRPGAIDEEYIAASELHFGGRFSHFETSPFTDS
jgi:hypothetical protein